MSERLRGLGSLLGILRMLESFNERFPSAEDQLMKTFEEGNKPFSEADWSAFHTIMDDPRTSWEEAEELLRSTVMHNAIAGMSKESLNERIAKYGRIAVMEVVRKETSSSTLSNIADAMAEVMIKKQMEKCKSCPKSKRCPAFNDLFAAMVEGVTIPRA